MGFLDKVKQGAEQATARAKETAEGLQTKRELGQAYGELGQTAFELADAGELSHPRLDPIVSRIRTLRAADEAGGGEGGGGGEPSMAATGEAQTATAAEPPPSNQPPAMPS